ncbi:MAG TPA: cytochrome c [Candidatus Binatia bacterium]|jgi:mono/diheme cytochrome c family protein|nr:cytochrome c [Candidatus Binatia bacterium]
MRRATTMAVLALGTLLASGCRQDMQDQPKYEPLEPSSFFRDGRASRPPVEGTVWRTDKLGDPSLTTGRVGAEYVEFVPLPVTTELLARGRQRYDIFCSPCHDRVGTGAGMIVLRGYRKPPSFHIERLREQRDGYFFDVITNGFGVMPNYAQQIPVDDRWAITAYIRALQLSQTATLADVPESERATLAGGAR